MRYSNSFAHIGMVGAARYLLRMSLYSPDLVDPRQAQLDVEILIAKLSKCKLIDRDSSLIFRSRIHLCPLA